MSDADADSQQLAPLGEIFMELRQISPPPLNRTEFQKTYPIEGELLIAILNNQKRLVREINENRRLLKELAQSGSKSIKKTADALGNASILVKRNLLGDEDGNSSQWRQKILNDFFNKEESS